MLFKLVLIVLSHICYSNAKLSFADVGNTYRRLISSAVEISNKNFNLRAATAILYSDVDDRVINDFINPFKGTVVIDARRNTAFPPKQIVVLVESFTSFLKILEKLKPDLNGRAFLNAGAKCVIVMFKYPHRLQRIYRTLWSYHAADVITLIGDSKGAVALYTYYPYSSPLNCINTDPTFIGFWQENTTNTAAMFPDKMSNMHKCPLYISTNKLYHPSTEKKIPIEIIKNTIVKLLRDVMNFTPVVFRRDYVSIDSDRATNWSDSLNDIIIGSANISTCSIPLGIDRLGLLEYTIPYFRVRLAWLAPPITPAPSWWRLISPLNGYLWVLLLIVTCFVQSLPHLLKMSPINTFTYKYFKKLREANSLALRAWGIMCGQPIRVLPQRLRDFYILTLWIWFTFVIRSVYQSVLIGALKTDTFVGGYIDLREAVDQGCQFGGRAGILGHFEHDPLIRNNFIVIPEEDFDATFHAIIKGQKKFLVATSLEYAWAFCVSKEVKENDCGHVLPDSIMTLPLVIWMQMYSPLTRPLSEWIPRFIEAGLLDRDIKVSTFRMFKSTEPSALTAKQTVSCLLCLVIGYAIAVVIFVLEILKRRWSNRLHVTFIN